MKVDNICSIMKVRWHPKISVEVCPDVGGHYRRYYQFIDDRTANAMGMNARGGRIHQLRREKFPK